eukprot:s3230_g2.t1
MCTTILRVFIVLVLVLQKGTDLDPEQYESYTETSAAKTARECPQRLASSSLWTYLPSTTSTQKDSGRAGFAPFQGSTLPAPHCGGDGENGSMALPILHEAREGQVRPMWWMLEEKGAKGASKSKDGKGKGSEPFAMAPPSTQWLSPPALPPSIEPQASSTTATLATSALASLQPFPKPKVDKDEAELQAYRQMDRDLKNKPNLAEDVKKVVASAEVVLRKEDTKSHSKLISQLNAARKKLSALDEEWEAYRFQWAGYLDKATQMWISHVEAYENGETKFAEKRKEALQVVQHTRVLLHEAHLRTMEHEGAIGRSEIESAQEALDATMKVEEAEDPATQNNLAQIKAELTGVVRQVKDTIEAKLKKRDRSTPSKEADADEVEVVEPQDKRLKEDFT